MSLRNLVFTGVLGVLVFITACSQKDTSESVDRPKAKNSRTSGSDSQKPILNPGESVLTLESVKKINYALLQAHKIFEVGWNKLNNTSTSQASAFKVVQSVLSAFISADDKLQNAQICEDYQPYLSIKKNIKLELSIYRVSKIETQSCVQQSLLDTDLSIKALAKIEFENTNQFSIEIAQNEMANEVGFFPSLQSRYLNCKFIITDEGQVQRLQCFDLFKDYASPDKWYRIDEFNFDKNAAKDLWFKGARMAGIEEVASFSFDAEVDLITIVENLNKTSSSTSQISSGQLSPVIEVGDLADLETKIAEPILPHQIPNTPELQAMQDRIRNSGEKHSGAGISLNTADGFEESENEPVGEGESTTQKNNLNASANVGADELGLEVHNAEANARRGNGIESDANENAVDEQMDEDKLEQNLHLKEIQENGQQVNEQEDREQKESRKEDGLQNQAEQKNKEQGMPSLR